MIRPLTPEDAHLVDPLARAAFDDLAVRQGREPKPPVPGAAEYREAVYRHLVAHGRAWGAFEDDRLVGAALTSQRPQVWTLWLLVVAPGQHGRGTGSGLLRTALEDAGPQRQVHASRDPVAARTYARAGFRLVPTVSAEGTVALPSGPAVVDAEPADDDEAAQVAAGCRLLRLADGRDGTCLVAPPLPAREVQVLRASEREAAADLLRGALATVHGSQVEVSFLAPQEDWAHGVVLDAGLSLVPSGPLCLSGLPALEGVTKPAGVFL